jgi:hypothetical protein
MRIDFVSAIEKVGVATAMPHFDYIGL